MWRLETVENVKACVQQSFELLTPAERLLSVLSPYMVSGTTFLHVYALFALYKDRGCCLCLFYTAVLTAVLSPVGHLALVSK